MIDWNKPIETVDGRKARMIGSHPEPRGHPDDEGYFVPRMVWVESASAHSFGDVFLVTDRGVRCDDTAWRARPLVPEVREPFIRNAPVKREGWILIGPPINGPSLLSRIVVTKHIYPSEQEALRAREELQYTTSVGTKAVFFQWEE